MHAKTNQALIISLMLCLGALSLIAQSDSPAANQFATTVESALHSADYSKLSPLIFTKNIPPALQKRLDDSYQKFMVFLRSQPSWTIKVIPASAIPERSKSHLNAEPLYGLEVLNWDKDKHRCIFPVCIVDGKHKLTQSTYDPTKHQ